MEGGRNVGRPGGGITTLPLCGCRVKCSIGGHGDTHIVSFTMLVTELLLMCLMTSGSFVLCCWSISR